MSKFHIPETKEPEDANQEVTNTTILEEQIQPKSSAKPLRKFILISLLFIAALFFVFFILRSYQLGDKKEYFSILSPGETPSLLMDRGLSQRTEALTGHLSLKQSATLPLYIDTNNASLFYLSWDTGTLDFTLIRPDGQVIDPAYAAANANEVTYESNPGGPDMPPFAGYYFPNNTHMGQWQLQITASNSGSNGTDYVAFAALETPRSLSVKTERHSYSPGQTAILNAVLQNDGIGITGATVVANLTLPNSQIDTLPMIEQSNGTYTATYVIPETSGFVSIVVTALGIDDGISFTRRIELLFTVTSAPIVGKFTSNYSDQPLDENDDGLYETLDFTFEINVKSPGDYILQADLRSGGQLIAQTAIDLLAEAGTQKVTLQFYGEQIRASQLNGPYTITNLHLVDVETDSSVQSVDNVWTTSPYNWNDFGSAGIQ